MSGNKLGLYSLLSIVLLSIVGGLAATSRAQESDALGRSKIYDETPNRRDVTIAYSFDRTGKVFKIIVQPTAPDSEPDFPRLMSYQETIAIVDEILPPAERGTKLRELKSYVTRGSIETMMFEKFQIDLARTCRYDVCGVSYVLIRRQ